MDGIILENTNEEINHGLMPKLGIHLFVSQVYLGQIGVTY